MATEANRLQDKARGDRHRDHWRTHDAYANPDPKWCHRCSTDKPRGEYAKNARRSDGLQQYCKDCHNAFKRAEFAIATAAAIEIYGGRCVECESDESLEFDHVNNDGLEHRKAEQSASMVRRIARIGHRLDEWQIQLLCRDCHLIKTSESRKGWIERLKAKHYAAGYEAALRDTGRIAA